VGPNRIREGKKENIRYHQILMRLGGIRVTNIVCEYLRRCGKMCWNLMEIILEFKKYMYAYIF
jgi:hypothetical protein